MTYLFSIGAAALYGAADFIGGLATRRSGALAVVLVSQAAGLLPLGLSVALLPPFSPTQADLLWGAGAGLTGGVGVLLLYRALAIGTMAVVAPITAVTAVVIPVVVSLLFGQRPEDQALAGIVVAPVSIVLVSGQEGARPADGGRLPPGVGTALGSGVAIGFLFLMLGQTGTASGLWPVVAARSVSVVLVGTIAIAGRQTIRMPGRVAALTVGAGVIDAVANALYVLAAQQGPLAVVVTLASLYPASTVLLARVVLRERLSPRQTAGVVLALAAVVLIVSAGR